MRLAISNRRVATRRDYTLDIPASQVSLAKSLFNPDLTAVVGGSLVSQSTIGVFSAEVGDFASFGRGHTRAGLDLVYNIDVAGRRIANVHAAQAALRSAVFSARSDELTELEAVINSFYTVLLGQQLVADGSLAIQAAQEHLRDAQSRLELGTVTLVDVDQAKSLVATAQSQEATRVGTLAGARAHLANLLGENPATVVPEAAPAGVARPITETASDLVQRALAYSPLRQSLLAHRQSARAVLSAIRAERSPSIGVGLSAGYLWAINFPNQPYLVISADFGEPLLNGANVHARERAQGDVVGQDDVQIQQTEADVAEQVQTLSASYRAGIDTVTAAEVAVSAAEDAFGLAREQYSVGKGTQAAVFDALNAMTVARDTLALDVNNRDMAAQELRWLTGADRPVVDIVQPGLRLRH